MGEPTNHPHAAPRALGTTPHPRLTPQILADRPPESHPHPSNQTKTITRLHTNTHPPAQDAQSHATRRSDSHKQARRHARHSVTRWHSGRWRGPPRCLDQGQRHQRDTPKGGRQPCPHRLALGCTSDPPAPPPISDVTSTCRATFPPESRACPSVVSVTRGDPGPALTAPHPCLTGILTGCLGVLHSGWQPVLPL